MQPILEFIAKLWFDLINSSIDAEQGIEGIRRGFENRSFKAVPLNSPELCTLAQGNEGGRVCCLVADELNRVISAKCPIPFYQGQGRRTLSKTWLDFQRVLNSRLTLIS